MQNISLSETLNSYPILAPYNFLSGNDNPHSTHWEAET